MFAPAPLVHSETSGPRTIGTVILMTNTTTTAPATKPATKGRKITAADKAALAADAAKLAADLRAQWAASEITQGQADDAWKAAQLAVENVRVVKSRIAYAAAMVTPYQDGTNLLNAVRILLVDPALPAAKATAAAKARKNTLRPYVLAGEALRNAGFNLRTTTPDDEERSIVDAAFRAYNREEAKAAKDAKAAAAATVATEDATESTTEAAPAEDDAALTFTALLAHVSRMNGTVDMLIKAQVPVSEDDMALLARCLDEVQVKLAVYAG